MISDRSKKTVFQNTRETQFMMKPEFLTRYLMFSLFGLFFIPWFFLLVAMVVTYAFATKGGYIVGGIAFIVFAWPFYIVTRGSYRRVKFVF
jgi:Ca2+-dependent lipid-binding protein